MKAKHLLASMFAALLFAGCSNEDGLTPDKGNENNGEPKFLTVSISATGGSLTRALDGTYEEGEQNENEVQKVRFYFFDQNGNAAKVKGENGDSYLDVTDVEEAGKDMNNVEKILESTLIIQTPQGDKIPTSVVAVVNPQEDPQDVTSLDKLNEIISNYNKTEDGFIMSNSVYANGEKKMETVDVAGHLYSNAEAAKQDPVIIHVERVLAKARLTVELTPNDNGVYKTSSDASQKFDDEEIYVKFLGWNVTATAEESRLMKEINPTWSSNLFTSTILWNTADYHRSFWAVNPATMSYEWGNFADHAQSIKHFDAGTGEEKKVNYTYLQENASDNYNEGSNPTTPTQVIIAAQLVKEDGTTPIEFAEYAGERTTVEGLKKKYAAASGLWTDIDGENGKRTITIDDIELKTATEAGVANQNTPGRYKVYAQLTAEAAQKNWYGSDAENASTVNADEILKGLGGAKVWADGYTYYYFDIRHLNDTQNGNGQYGVVRNHIYAANVTSLVGLGTPVYNPNETIYPEKTQDDDTYIAAQIRILSWRIVNQNIDLVW